MRTLRHNTTCIRKKDVEETNAFQALSKIRQSIIRSWNNIKAIDNNVKGANYLGLEVWLERTCAKNINRQIVEELVNQRK